MEKLFPQKKYHLQNHLEYIEQKLISSKILDGDLGVKSGKGFYEWNDKKKRNWKKHMLDWLILLEQEDKNSQ